MKILIKLVTSIFQGLVYQSLIQVFALSLRSIAPLLCAKTVNAFNINFTKIFIAVGNLKEAIVQNFVFLKDQFFKYSCKTQYGVCDLWCVVTSPPKYFPGYAPDEIIPVLYR